MLFNCNRKLNLFLAYTNYKKILNCRYLHCSYIIYLHKPSTTENALESFKRSQQSTNSGLFKIQETLSNINKNFYGIEGDEGVIIVDETIEDGKTLQDLVETIRTPKSEFRAVSFGAVRLDSENAPSYYARKKMARVETEENADFDKTSDKDQSTSSQLMSDEFNKNTVKVLKDNHVDDVLEKEVKMYKNHKEIEITKNHTKNFPVNYIDNLYFSEEHATEDSETYKMNNYTKFSKEFINKPKQLANDFKPYDVNLSKNKINEDNLVFKNESETIIDDFNLKNKSETNLDDFAFKNRSETDNFIFNKNNFTFDDKNNFSINDNINMAAKYDHDNPNQSETAFENSASDSAQFNSQNGQMSDSYIDKYYFEEQFKENASKTNNDLEFNFVDEQYFNEYGIMNNEKLFFENKNNLNDNFENKNNLKDNFENDNIIEGNAVNNDKTNIYKNNEQLLLHENISNDLEDKSLPFISTETKLSPRKLNTYNSTISSQLSSKFQEKNSGFSDFTNSNSSISYNSSISSKSISKEKNLKASIPTMNKFTNVSDLRPNGSNLSESEDKLTEKEDKPETAYDFVKKLRETQVMNDLIKKGISAKKEKKVDSKGFRILKHQVPSLIYFTRDEMLELLSENVLYSDDDIIVLNKPYNLIMHESQTTKDNACLSMYLKDLAAILDKNSTSPELFTVHRLDKETTGCLLLARNEIAAQRIKSLFAQRKIIKTYWIVTSKVPDPMEGVIDIPISEGKIDKRARMVLHPDLPDDVPYSNHSKCGKRAVTAYSVIATSGNAALVEVKPETGIKHQIRVHFGFGLNCAILGDHKYSHLTKLAPQKLPSDLLQRLAVRQSKVRHIPLHIHAKHVLIPSYLNEKNLFVTAPLPKHMVENLRSLKFKKK